MVTRQALPPLRLIAVFDAVNRCGSLQKAAAELQISQSAVSQAIRQLEDFVGTRLLNRDTRPASLTEAGELLQRGVSKGLQAIGNSVAEVRALQAASQQSVTVACTIGTATYWLMPCLTGFHEHHAGAAVSVRTVAAGPPRITPGVDVAIRYGLGDWAEGVTKLLFRERGVPVCAPSVYRELINRQFSLDDATLLHVDSGDLKWFGWREYVDHCGMATPIKPGRVFTNYVQATQGALAGQGVMLGWRSMVSELVKEGQLMELPLPSIIPEEAFYLVTSDEPRKSKTLDALIRWLMKAGLATDIAVSAPARTQ